jgi:hypothetical protein
VTRMPLLMWINSFPLGKAAMRPQRGAAVDSMQATWRFLWNLP